MTTVVTSIFSSTSTERSAGSELLEVLGLSVGLSELLGARVDVVTPRTLRPDVRELALAEPVPLPRTGEEATLAVPDDPPADS